MLLVGFAGASAVEPSDGVAVVKKLRAITVTVRVSPRDVKSGKPSDVTVFTGVSLGKGLIITFGSAPSTWRYRLTLPDGAQADGKLRVIDRYSGLRLLEISQKDLPSLTPVSAVPPVGTTLYTAAAAGIDKPIVSRGILGGVGRNYSRRRLPPLLQCDVRTTDTSSGAAVVDGQGRLVGVIAVNATPGQGNGWTYVVPVRHVQRVQRAYVKGESTREPVILHSQRPVVGMIMKSGGNDRVAVQSVVQGGPAEKAGIRKGDRVLAVDDQQVRSVYQVVNLVLKRQPGDRMTFSILQGGKDKRIQVTLGGVPLDGLTLLGNRFQRRPRPLNFKPDKENKTAGVRVPRDPEGQLDEQMRLIFKYLDKLHIENSKLKSEVNELRKQLQAAKKR